MSNSRYLELLPRDRLESNMDDLKPAYTPAQAVAEANRCIYCHDAPCVNACPTHINIPEFIRKIATNNVTGSAKTILTANILGFSCARVCPVEVLCVGDCVYNEMGIPPIQIGKLQRYATDGIVEKNVRFWEKGAPTGKKVAFIGGGPASLSAAHELTKLGHHCVIFEGRTLPGGLNTTGVAPYKMRAEDALREVQYVLEIGIEVRTGKWIGKDVKIADLEREFDAIFLGIGLGLDSRLEIPGKSLGGVRGAVDFIEQLKNQPKFDVQNVKAAAVIGGGNTALDVVRELKKCGIPRVVMVYRRGEEDMGGYKHEYDWAKKEGCEFAYLSLPVAYEGNGNVVKMRLTRMELSAPDGQGKHTVVPVPGSDYTMDVDLVVEAIGQGKLVEFTAQVPDLKTDRGRILVDPKTGQTSNKKYFAGGDCVNGGKEVVNAVEEGKVAAGGIHRYLMGEL
jgi:dihydropyrimidine dehydrogenase (NAD+) subunit PreT